jgi:hypothetical protein
MVSYIKSSLAPEKIREIKAENTRQVLSHLRDNRLISREEFEVELGLIENYNSTSIEEIPIAGVIFDFFGKVPHAGNKNTVVLVEWHDMWFGDMWETFESIEQFEEWIKFQFFYSD